MSAEVHGSFRELMDRRLAGDVSADEERLLEEHLAGCSECAAYYGGWAAGCCGVEWVFV